MKLTKYLIAAIAVLTTVCSVRADEGMWLLQLMKQQNSIDMMKKQGLKLEVDDIYNPNGVSLRTPSASLAAVAPARLFHRKD